jgi:hypothetical protein
MFLPVSVAILFFGFVLLSIYYVNKNYGTHELSSAAKKPLRSSPGKKKLRKKRYKNNAQVS